MRTRTPWFFCFQHFAFGRFGRTAPTLALVLSAALYLTITPSYGQQNPFTQILGNTDQGIVLPQSVPLVSRQDAGALAEIQAYRSAISLGSWVDMQAVGSLTPNTSDPSAVPATRWIRGQRGYRLDIQKPKGTSSLRMDGTYGALQHQDGHMRAMNARDAVAGLLAFPMLMDPNFPAASAMLIDQGTVTVDGVALHRITVERPWPGNPVGVTSNPLTTVTDLYFNLQTHLLVKSANGVVGLNPSSEQLLQVITYGDYQAVNGMQVPAEYRETLNGQVLWTLQLNQIHLNQGLPESNFHF